jgi:putative MATE family efflux protein
LRISNKFDSSGIEKLLTSLFIMEAKFTPEPTSRPQEDAAVAASSSSSRRIWSALREAIRGSQQDYTEVTIGRAVLLLAVPMVLETCMESIFAVVDIFFVSKLGASAMATVGLTEATLTLLYSVAIGLSMGAAAIVARRIGEKNSEGAAIAAVQGIVLGVSVAIPVAVAGIFFAPKILLVMGASPEVVQVGSGYTAVMYGGNATILLLFLINAIFRGAGDPAIAMRVLWFANSINIVLGPCLIFGLGPFPELGVRGAAIATTIGRGCGVLFQVFRLIQRNSRIQIHRRHIRLNLPVISSMVRISGTGILQSLVHTTSWIGLIRILSSFGTAAVAGYIVGIRIIAFAILPSWGMSNAAATLVGQNLGAKKPDRAEQSVWMTCRYNAIFLGIVGVLFVLFAEPLIHLFTKDPTVAPYGIRCLRIVSCGFLFYAYGMVLTQAFNGAGDTTTPTLINLFCFWFWEIPLGYILAKVLGFGPSGVFLAITVAFSTLAIVSAIIFRKGHWKLRQI